MIASQMYHSVGPVALPALNFHSHNEIALQNIETLYFYTLYYTDGKWGVLLVSSPPDSRLSSKVYRWLAFMDALCSSRDHGVATKCYAQGGTWGLHNRPAFHKGGVRE